MMAMLPCRSPRPRNPHRTVFYGLSLLWIAVLAGCAVQTAPPEAELPALVRIRPAAYPHFSDDMHYDGLLHAIDRSVAYLERLPPDREFTFGHDIFPAAHVMRSLLTFRDFIHNRPSSSELNRFIADRYWVYRTAGSDRQGRVLFTGYYEPVLQGSLEPTAEFPVPVYALPRDLVTIDLGSFAPDLKGRTLTGRFTGQTLVPYYDRREIETLGKLGDRAPTLLWLKDPVDLFFLQVQGSGRVYLQNGQTRNLHYHAANGRPYRSIGKLLIEEGKIARDQMSMQAIRDYLRRHPSETPTILNHNPSYVFFKTETDGPLGALGVKLTPGRSVALDRRPFPPTGLLFIETRQPLVDGDLRIRRWTGLRRFALAQDTGGAIRGPGRADLFWGNGPYAEIAAGHLQHPGTFYFLVLKPQPAG